MATTIQEGRYSLIYPSGDYRTLRFKTPTKGGLVGRMIISIKVGNDYEGCAFLLPNGKVAFWNRFRQANSQERLQRIERAVARILADPPAAGLAYAMKEGRCSRCGTELTVPASIHNGLGPDCAKKSGWRKADQVAAYRAAEAAAENFNDRWAAMKNKLAEHEREQEQRSFMSDPDFLEHKAEEARSLAADILDQQHAA
jgi:hypothetical protein